MSSRKDNFFPINNMLELSILLENLPDAEIKKVMSRKTNNIVYGDIPTEIQKKWPYEKLLQYTTQGLVLRRKSNNDLEVWIVVSIMDVMAGYVGKPSCFNKYGIQGPLTGHPGCLSATFTKNNKGVKKLIENPSPMTEEIEIPMKTRMGILKAHFENSFFKRVKNKGTAEEKKSLFIKMIKRYHNTLHKDKSFIDQLSPKHQLSLILKEAQ